MFLSEKEQIDDNGLSIIIVNYYSESYVEPLVESIVSFISIKNYEVIIVNNSPASFKWSDGYLQEHRIRLIFNEKNKGFGIGVNIGVNNAKYKYFCMINPDIEINNNTIDELYEFFQTLDDSVGAVSCLIKNSDGSRQNTFFMDNGLPKKKFAMLYIRTLFPGKIRRYVFNDKLYLNFELDTCDFSKPFEVGGFYCPFVMMKKTAFKSVGGFDPDFFMYAEDVDLFRTRFQNKYKSLYYPLVELTHFSMKTDKYGLMHHQAQVSYLLYLRKAGNYYLFIYVLLLSMKYALLLLHTLIKKRTDKKEALGFFRSLRYLAEILRFPRGYGTLPGPLKIDDIPD